MPKNKSPRKTKRQTRKTQKGGGRAPPHEGILYQVAQYNDTNQTVQNTSAYGPNGNGRSLGASPGHSGQQTGGALFSTIINPKTGRKVSIFGKTGLQILKRYIKQSGGRVTMPSEYFGKDSGRYGTDASANGVSWGHQHANNTTGPEFAHIQPKVGGKQTGGSKKRRKSPKKSRK
jgi:hypothetical protein